MSKIKKSIFGVGTAIIMASSAFCFTACGTDGQDGRDGKNAVMWYYGTETPTLTNRPGNIGDFYIDQDDNIIYQLTTNGWSMVSNMGSSSGGSDGKDGIDGATWLTGTDVPTSLQGKNGDFYLNSTTCDVYFKSNSSWGSPIANIKGANGSDGVTPTITVSTEGVILINGVETDLKKFTVDETLQNSGEAADAKIVGDKIAELEKNINNGAIDIDRLSSYQNTIIYNKTNLISDDIVWTRGYINIKDGNIGSNDNYACNETHIPVEPGKSYALFADQTNVTVIHYAFYDINRKFISGAEFGADANVVTTPENARYIRVSINKNNLDIDKLIADEYEMEFYNQSSAIYSAPQAIATITGLDASDTIIDSSISVIKCDFFEKIESPNLFTEVHMGYTWSPALASMQQNQYSGSYGVIPNIKVVPGQVVTVYDDVGNQLNIRMVAMFDENGAVIKTKEQEGVNINLTEFRVPVGCEYVAVTIYKSQYEKNEKIQVQCKGNSEFLGKYYEPGVAIYRLKDQYFEYSANKNKTVHAYLPNELCIAEGKTIELYNSQICLEYKNYHFQWIASDFGRPYERKFSITGTPNLTGQTKTLTLNIVNDNLETVFTANCTVKFVSNVISQQQLIIPIGDSLTNNKAWLQKVYEDSNGQIKFRGTQGTTDKTVDNGITHEGRSGAGTSWYNLGTSKYTFNPTNTTLEVKNDGSTPYTTNPFWNPTTDSFDFDYYCNSTADGGAGYFQDSEGNEISIIPTGIQIYLGTNGIKLDSTDAVTCIKGLINRIKNSDKGKNIPIYVVNTLFRPSQIFAVNSDGYATNSAGEFSFQANMKVMNLETALYNELKDMEDVFFIPVASTHDSEYNFPYEEVPVNPYLPDITTKEYTDCVHPSKAGYYQMADIIYSTIAAHYSDYITKT